MLEGYSDRMLRAPRFVREGVSGCPTAALHEGGRLIPEAALVRVKPAAESCEAPKTGERS
jgi:hypothetical protein